MNIKLKELTIKIKESAKIEELKKVTAIIEVSYDALKNTMCQYNINIIEGERTLGTVKMLLQSDEPIEKENINSLALTTRQMVEDAIAVAVESIEKDLASKESNN